MGVGRRSAGQRKRARTKRRVEEEKEGEAEGKGRGRRKSEKQRKVLKTSGRTFIFSSRPHKLPITIRLEAENDNSHNYFGYITTTTQ